MVFIVRFELNTSFLDCIVNFFKGGPLENQLC